MRSDRSSARRRRQTTIHDGPLPHLIFLLVRAVVWIARRLAFLIRAAASAVAELRGAQPTLSVVALLANPKRAAAIERALKAAARRHIRAFNLDLAAPLLVLVRETTGPLGDDHSTVEHETQADGTPRWIITLAVWPRGTAMPIGPDGLIAELSRQLVQLQRSSQGAGVNAVAASPDTWAFAHQRRQRDPRFHIVSAAGARDGHGNGPFDHPPATA